MSVKKRENLHSVKTARVQCIISGEACPVTFNIKNNLINNLIILFQVDVRNLIQDLDDNIKADTMMSGREKSDTGPPPPQPPPHIPVGGAPSRPPSSSPMSRPVSHLTNGQSKPGQGTISGSNFVKHNSDVGSNATTDSNSSDSEKSLKMKIKRTKSGRQEIVKTEGGQLHASANGDSESGSSGPNSSPPSPRVSPNMDINGDTKINVINNTNSNGNSNTTTKLQNSNGLKVR